MYESIAAEYDCIPVFDIATREWGLFFKVRSSGLLFLFSSFSLVSDGGVMVLIDVFEHELLELVFYVVFLLFVEAGVEFCA